MRALAAILFAACLFFVSTSAASDDTITTSTPLVSVIIPTYQRSVFLTRTLRLIRAQDYSNIEIVVVDDSPEASLSPDIVQELNVRYFFLSERKSIGEKRNLAVSNAQGEVIVHWDDDDFFRPHRISSQVQPILSGEADMTVLEHHYYLNAATKEFYTVKRASSWGPHFATFVYKKSIFTESGVRYPDNSMAEDYAFAESALEKGYKILVLSNTDGKHIYVRHTNTWKIDFSLFDAQVTKVDKPDFMPREDVDFYASASVTTATAREDPVNNFASDKIKWNRAELHPIESRSGSPSYPHYDTFTYNKGGQIISIPVAAVLVVLTILGVAAIFYYQRKQGFTEVGGYQPLSQVEDEKSSFSGGGRGYGSV